MADKDKSDGRANAVFAASERRDAEAKRIIEAERAASDAKTAKLRALRLAKEETDRLAAPPPAPKKAPRKSKAKTPTESKQEG